uniref:Uncharacterized protein n=1 Tax=Romanomermis culicivorax TaxID=13658 RepID=A0A915K962_ROMCU
DHFDSGIDLSEETSHSLVDADQNNESLESLRALCETHQKSLDEQLRENFRLHQQRKTLKEEATLLDDALKEGREILAVFDTADDDEEKKDGLAQ